MVKPWFLDIDVTVVEGEVISSVSNSSSDVGKSISIVAYELMLNAKLIKNKMIRKILNVFDIIIYMLVKTNISSFHKMLIFIKQF